MACSLSAGDGGGVEMTFDEWLIDEFGPNNDWSFFEKENGRRAWDAAKKATLLEAAERFDKDSNYGNPIFVLRKMADGVAELTQFNALNAASNRRADGSYRTPPKPEEGLK
jgi:hypothetical protein